MEIAAENRQCRIAASFSLHPICYRTKSLKGYIVCMLSIQVAIAQVIFLATEKVKRKFWGIYSMQQLCQICNHFKCWYACCILVYSKLATSIHTWNQNCHASRDFGHGSAVLLINSICTYQAIHDHTRLNRKGQTNVFS